MADSSRSPKIYDEVVDDEYEPTEEEVADYAKFLGMDPITEPHLLWIAREGLKAPLPEDWKAIQLENSDEIYYFNFNTGESVWDHPCDEYYRKLYLEEKRKYTEQLEKSIRSPVAGSPSKDVKRVQFSFDSSDIRTPKTPEEVEERNPEMLELEKERLEKELDEKHQFLQELNKKREEWRKEMQELESLERRKLQKELEDKVARLKAEMAEAERKEKEKMEQEMEHKLEQWKLELEQKRTEEMELLLKNKEDMKKQAERFLEEERKNLIQLENDLRANFEEKKRRGQEKLAKELQELEKQFAFMLEQHSKKLQEDYAIREKQEEIKFEKRMHEMKMRLTQQLEEEEKLERQRLKAASKERVDKIRRDIDLVEQELKNLVREHKERKEALIAKKNIQLEEEIKQVEQLEKVLEERKKKQEAELQNLDEEIQRRVLEKQREKEMLDRSLQEAKDNHRREMLELKQKFEAQKQEIEKHQEEIQSLKDQVSRELQRFQEQEKRKLEHDKAILRANYNRQLKEAEEQLERDLQRRRQFLKDLLKDNFGSSLMFKDREEVKTSEAVEGKEEMILPVQKEASKLEASKSKLPIASTPEYSRIAKPPSFEQLSPICAEKQVPEREQPTQMKEEITKLQQLREKLRNEENRLWQLKNLVVDRVDRLKKKQQDLIGARQDWKKQMRQLESENPPSEGSPEVLGSFVALLMRLQQHSEYLAKRTELLKIKETLENQTANLNKDIRRINRTKEWVKASEARLIRMHTELNESLKKHGQAELSFRTEDNILSTLLTSIGHIELELSELVKEVRSRSPPKGKENRDPEEKSPSPFPEPIPPPTHVSRPFRRKHVLPTSHTDKHWSSKLSERQLQHWSAERQRASEYLAKHSLWLESLKEQVGKPLNLKKTSEGSPSV